MRLPNQLAFIKCLYAGTPPISCLNKIIHILQGWYKSSSFDMNSFYNILPLKEKQRVNTLEMFDEYEEWHCKCNHYMLLYAFQGTCSALSSVLPIPNLLIQSGKCIQGKELEILPLEMKCGSAPITR